MPNLANMVPIPGSRRSAVPDSTRVGKADPDERIRVSVYARTNPRPPARLGSALEKQSLEAPGKRHYLSDEEFNAAFGADQDDLTKIADYAKSKGLTVLDTSVPQRRVLVEGRIADVNEAFGTSLAEYEHPGMGRFRGREGEIHVPAALDGVIEGVFGLDTRRVGRPRLRRSRLAPVRIAGLPHREEARTETRAHHAGGAHLTNPFPGTFFPPEVGALYDYPHGTDGSGQTVAIFAFNGDFHGGYDRGALETYFQSVLGGHIPRITDVVVQGPGNDPGPDTRQSERKGDTTGEIMLDICVVGSVAPKADVLMYFTIFSTQGWVDALHRAIADNQASVISISYGNPEDDPQGAWTKMGVKVVNTAFKAAAARGITICCASGDDGSGDADPDGLAHTDFPASSPWVLGVGGTRLESSGGAHPTITAETVWNDTLQDEGAGGGGISHYFSKPAYQHGVTVPRSANPPHRIGRGVPDVSAVGDPETGVVIMHIDGKHLEATGGTSVAAPLWASLVARLDQALNARCGFLNPLLYTKMSKGVLRDITEGDNGAYAAGPGWDACTGLGSPDGGRLLTALR
jgi:kumamolisin